MAAGQCADAAAAGDRAQLTLQPHLAHLINEVNRRQQAYDRAWDEIRSLRHRIFADWCKYMVSIDRPADDLLSYQDADFIKYFMRQNDVRLINWRD